jgi:hypothetical protein
VVECCLNYRRASSHTTAKEQATHRTGARKHQHTRALIDPPTIHQARANTAGTRTGT